MLVAMSATNEPISPESQASVSLAPNCKIGHKPSFSFLCQDGVAAAGSGSGSGTVAGDVGLVFSNFLVASL